MPQNLLKLLMRAAGQGPESMQILQVESLLHMVCPAEHYEYQVTLAIANGDVLSAGPGPVYPVAPGSASLVPGAALTGRCDESGSIHFP